MHASTPSSRLGRFDSRHAQWLTAVLCIVAAVANLALFLTGKSVFTPLLMFNMMTFVIVCAVQLHSRRLIQLQPRELAERLLHVQESERQRLSRELHDDIGQMLTAARMQNDWLLRRLPADLHPHGEQLGTVLEETLNKVRDLSAILNPRQLSSLGLEASLRAHLITTLADSPVRWSFECQQRVTGVPDEMAMAAFRITQEAVTNMLRHAQARNLLVRLQRLPAGLSLFISDDGIGFEPAIDPAGEGQRGIAGMTERVALLGGCWTLHSCPGQGTRIDVLLPWPARERERATSFKKPQ
ncbi:MAG: signal transduction histidine kinase [Pseudomonas sp.]|jgi:signal transduction histidine kinase|nr:signal transduction histidine kinase [Pseudomonas sp.]